jgi:23S rRNA pseudouridine1911/1915/1917 synthase
MQDGKAPDRPIKLRLDVPTSLDGHSLAKIISVATRCSRKSAGRAVKFGAVRLDGEVSLRPQEPVKAGVLLTVDYVPGMDSPWTPEIIFEDEQMLVLNKPGGVPVYSTRAGGGNSVEQVLAGIASNRWQPRLVHRLDLPVSGLLIVAKTREAARQLSTAFRQDQIEKTYLAVVHTAQELPEVPITVDAPLLWLAGKQRAMVAPDGRPSKTVITAARELPEGKALVSIKLLTGRTHQARCHLAHLGFPVAADKGYGSSITHPTPQIALHAARLTLSVPVMGIAQSWTQIPPAEFWGCAGLPDTPDLAKRLLASD